MRCMAYQLVQDYLMPTLCIHYITVYKYILDIWYANTFLNEPKLFILRMVKWFQTLQYNSRNKTSVNDQTFLFQTIKFSMNIVWTQFKIQTVLFDPQIGLYQVLSLRARVDLGAMPMKRYFTFPKVPGLELHHQIVKCHIQNTRWGVFLLCRDAVGVFCSSSRLGWEGFGLVSLFDGISTLVGYFMPKLSL